MQYSITYGPSNQVLAISQYDILPATLGAGEYACSLAQFNNPGAWIPSGGVLIANPNAAALALSAVKTAQIATLTAAYNAAIQQPVSYMSTTFQADSGSQQTLTRCLVAGSVPAGFYWLDANNVQVPMTFAQLQGLASAMLVQGQAAFTRLQARKASVNGAATIASVQAVAW